MFFPAVQPSAGAEIPAVQVTSPVISRAVGTMSALVSVNPYLRSVRERMQTMSKARNKQGDLL